MQYQVRDENGRKYILFDDEQYIGLQELINTIELYKITLDEILEKIELVQSGSSLFEEIGTEKAMIEMSSGRAEIYDLFQGLVTDEDLFPTIEISLENLKEIVCNCKKIM